MNTNTKLVDQMSKLGLAVSLGKSKVHRGNTLVEIDGRLGAVKRFIHAAEKKQLAWSRPLNSDDVLNAQLSNGGNEKWRGGTVEDLRRDLAGGRPMDAFHAARDQLDKSDVAKRVRAAFAEGKPKRVRQRSEYEGDWNYSNRWDIKPFDAAARKRQLIRMVTLVADFSINSGTTADSINRFGAMCWAISDLLETSGISTRIIFRQRSTRIGEQFQKADQVTRIVLKDLGEYLSPQNLAGAMTSLFYRRAVFCLMVAGPDILKSDRDWGLGRSLEPEKQVEFKNGELILSSSTRGLTPEVEKELLKALNVTAKHAGK